MMEIESDMNKLRRNVDGRTRRLSEKFNKRNWRRPCYRFRMKLVLLKRILH